MERELYGPALYDWDEALRRQPLNADFVVSKTDVLLRMKRNDEAWATLQEAMSKGVPRAALKEWIDKCK